jgi:hypothetical protein
VKDSGFGREGEVEGLQYDTVVKNVPGAGRMPAPGGDIS